MSGVAINRLNILLGMEIKSVFKVIPGTLFVVQTRKPIGIVNEGTIIIATVTVPGLSKNVTKKNVLFARR